MKRRIILVAAIVLVAGTVVGGLVWYFHYSGGSSLLRRAEVALEARKYDKAVELASQYAGETGDWQGYLVIGRAQNALGDHEAARAALNKARADKSNQDIYIALADTYALPARKLLAQRGGDRLTAVDQAIVLFESARSAIQSYPEKDVPLALQAYEGLNCMALARATLAQSEALTRQANTARAGGLTQQANKLSTAGLEAQKKSQDYNRHAAAVLLKVVKTDPTRAVAADALAQVGIELKDDAIIDQTRKALSAVPLEKRPPLAWGQLVLEGLDLTQYPVADPQRSQCIARIDEIESILARHADDRLASEDLCVLRRRMGQAYTRLDMADKALAMYDLALRANGRDPLSQLFRGQVLLNKGDIEGAHNQLYALVSSYGDWSEGHYWYAQVAIRKGDTTLAMQSLRRCAQLDMSHAASREAIIDLLLAQKPPRAQEAYDDAVELLAIDRTDAGAIDRFVEVARQLNRPELADAQLAKIQQDYADQAPVLWSVLQAYMKLSPSRTQLHRELATRIIALPAKTIQDRVVQARAYQVLGRQSEAESILVDLVRQNPAYASLHYELGLHHDSLGRLFQASECYSRAIELDPRNRLYNKALARVMIQMGNTPGGSQLVDQLRQDDPQDVTAAMFEAQMNVMQDVDPAATIAKLEKVITKDEASLLVAFAELRKGNNDQCLALCKQALVKDPNDVEVLALQAQALQAKGMHKEAIDAYKKIIAQKAESIVSYVAMAGQVIASMTPAEQKDADAKTILAAMQCPDARTDLMQLAVGKVMEDNRRYEMAVDVYHQLSDDASAPRESREQAQLREALCCYAMGKTDVALGLLSVLKSAQSTQLEAAFTYAQIMCAVGKGPQAQADIQALWDKAIAQEDYSQLAQVARLMVAAGAGDKALAALAQTAQRAAKDARPYRLMVFLLQLTAQDAKALPVYRKILELQPGSFRTYTQYAAALDRCQDPLGALAVLDKLQAQGKAGQYQAILARAELLARWGLKTQATAAFRQSEEYYKASPSMLLALAQQYFALGQRDDARRVLAMVPTTSPLHRRAEGMAAMALDTPAQRVAAMGEIGKTYGMNATLLVLMMQVHLEDNQAAAALELYKQSKLPPAQLQAASALAVRAMIQLGQLPDACQLTNSLVQQGQTSWRPIATLLWLAQGKTDQARALIGPAQKAGLYEAIAGVLAAEPAKADAYYQRALHLCAQTNLLPAQKASQAILLHLSMGKADQAARELEVLKGLGMMVYDGPAELVKSADTPQAQTEARRLLLVSLAYTQQQPIVARALAIEALKARTSGHWAAVLAVRGADAATIAQVQSLYSDKAGALGCRLLAMKAMAANDPASAAVQLEKALKQRPGDAEVLVQLAETCNKCGNAPRALELYMQAIAAKAGPYAANNAAYIVALRYAGDKARLTQARGWIDQAMKDNPGDTSMYDTAGWLAYLLGNTDQACRELHQAVKAMPDSPDVHYHLGMAHKLAGHADLAQMHLKQAIDLGEKLKTGGQSVSSETAESIKLAQAELKKS